MSASNQKRDGERRTAALVAAVLAAGGGLSFWRGHPTRAEVLLSCAFSLLAAGLVSRRFARWFHRVWMRAALAAGAANAVVVLGLVYLIGFVGCRCWGRIVGRDSLGRRAPPQTSYWIARARTHPSPWQFERLY